MSNKEIVKTLFPNARQESHVSGFPRERYYLIRNGREFNCMSEGNTAAKAWKNAVPVALDKAAFALREQEQAKTSNKEA